MSDETDRVMTPGQEAAHELVDVFCQGASDCMDKLKENMGPDEAKRFLDELRNQMNDLCSELLADELAAMGHDPWRPSDG